MPGMTNALEQRRSRGDQQDGRSAELAGARAAAAGRAGRPAARPRDDARGCGSSRAATKFEQQDQDRAADRATGSHRVTSPAGRCRSRTAGRPRRSRLGTCVSRSRAMIDSTTPTTHRDHQHRRRRRAASRATDCPCERQASGDDERAEDEQLERRAVEDQPEAPGRCGRAP